MGDLPWIRFSGPELHLDGRRTQQNMATMTSEDARWEWLQRVVDLPNLKICIDKNRGHIFLVYVHEDLIQDGWKPDNG